MARRDIGGHPHVAIGARPSARPRWLMRATRRQQNRGLQPKAEKQGRYTVMLQAMPPPNQGGDFRLRKKYSLRRFRFSFQLFILPSWPRKAKRRTIVNVRPNVALLFEGDVRWSAGAR